jgi:hypothetical protein
VNSRYSQAGGKRQEAGGNSQRSIKTLNALTTFLPETYCSFLLTEAMPATSFDIKKLVFHQTQLGKAGMKKRENSFSYSHLINRMHCLPIFQ